MREESRASEALRSLQEWFAGVITQPLEPGSQIQSKTPSGQPIEKEAARYIRPSLTLAPHKRMQLYNQQYWWRLLSILANEYPMLEHLFGRDGFFASIAVPYLCTYPPNHWSLELLGERLPYWVDEHYQEEDRNLVTHAAQVDWAFSYAMVAGERMPLSLAKVREEEDIATIPLYLQPYVTPFSLPYNLFAFRERLLEQESTYWLDHEFPPLPQEKERYCFVFYREESHTLFREEIDLLAYRMLALFYQGTTLEEVCTQIEDGDSFSETEIKTMPTYLQNWAARGWLTRYPRHSDFTSFTT